MDAACVSASNRRRACCLLPRCNACACDRACVKHGLRLPENSKEAEGAPDGAPSACQKTPGLSRAAALALQSRAATGAARAQSLAAQGFLCTERWPRHRRKCDVKSSKKWRCHFFDSQKARRMARLLQFQSFQAIIQRHAHIAVCIAYNRSPPG